MRIRRSKQREELKALYIYIAEKLLLKGFDIYGYESFSSNSFYLKLDAGLCGSLRISDHQGKSYLNYTYNILTCEPEMWVDFDGRYFYNLKFTDVCVDNITTRRVDKVTQWGGPEKYKAQLFSVKDNNIGKKKGFWSKCKKLTLENLHED